MKKEDSHKSENISPKIESIQNATQSIGENENKIDDNKGKEIKEKIVNDKIKPKKENYVYKKMPISTNRTSNNILYIRKQSNEEEEILAKKNTGIREIKVNNSNAANNIYSNYKKSKSLSRQIYQEKNDNLNNVNKTVNTVNNNRKSNSNHNFLNINLCKDKDNISIIYLNSAKNNINDNSSFNLMQDNKNILPFNHEKKISNNRGRLINKSYFYQIKHVIKIGRKMKNCLSLNKLWMFYFPLFLYSENHF